MSIGGQSYLRLTLVTAGTHEEGSPRRNDAGNIVPLGIGRAAIITC